MLRAIQGKTTSTPAHIEAARKLLLEAQAINALVTYAAGFEDVEGLGFIAENADIVGRRLVEVEDLMCGRMGVSA